MGTAVSPDIVFSLAGHDKGRAYIVLRQEGDRLVLTDGKLRKLDKPKKKNLRHTAYGGKASPGLGAALESGTATDRQIRRELAIFAARSE